MSSSINAPRSRRDLIKAGASGAGLLFCGCGMLASAAAPPAHRSFSLRGKRVRTVDTHAHCVFEPALQLLDPAIRNSLLHSPQLGAGKLVMNFSERLQDMDAMGIDMQVLSINPLWYGCSRETSARIVEIQNRALADIVRSNSARFAAFGSISLQFPDLAVTELEYAVSELGLCGAAIGSNVGDLPFSDPSFDPVWAKASELGATLYIHPAAVPNLDRELSGNGWLKSVIGIPLASTIALSHLIFEGTLDKFPELKLMVAHGGGYLPSYAARSNRGCVVSPTDCNPKIQLKMSPAAYLRKVFIDNLVFTSEGLRHLIAEVGISQIVMGSDYPYPWVDSPVDVVMEMASLNDRDRAAILGDNARRILRLPSSGGA